MSLWNARKKGIIVIAAAVCLAVIFIWFGFENNDGKPGMEGAAFAADDNLVGRWYKVAGGSSAEEIMDLLKDGTGIVDGVGITWKVENGRFYLISPLFGFSSIYNVSGSTLTLTKDDGEKLTFKKK